MEVGMKSSGRRRSLMVWMTLGDIVPSLQHFKSLNPLSCLCFWKEWNESKSFIPFFFFLSSENPSNGLVRRAILSFYEIISKLDTTIKFIARKQ